jgi:hypothetical protein
MRALIFTVLIAIFFCVCRSDVAYAAKISANNMNFTIWDQLLKNYVYKGRTPESTKKTCMKLISHNYCIINSKKYYQIIFLIFCSRL